MLFWVKPVCPGGKPTGVFAGWIDSKYQCIRHRFERVGLKNNRYPFAANTPATAARPSKKPGPKRCNLRHPPVKEGWVGVFIASGVVDGRLHFAPRGAASRQQVGGIGGVGKVGVPTSPRRADGYRQYDKVVAPGHSGSPARNGVIASRGQTIQKSRPEAV
jgi:hypothetical protein